MSENRRTALRDLSLSWIRRYANAMLIAWKRTASPAATPTIWSCGGVHSRWNEIMSRQIVTAERRSDVMPLAAASSRILRRRSEAPIPMSMKSTATCVPTVVRFEIKSASCLRCGYV